MKSKRTIRNTMQPNKAEDEVKKLSIIVEKTADAVIVTDKDGIIQYVNPAFEEITGYKKKEVIGKTPRIIKSGLYPQSFYEKLWTTILSGKVFRATIANRKKNNELFYVDHTITPIKNGKDAILYFVGMWKDVTVRIQLEKRKDEFISVASHELKTPITTISAYAQFLENYFRKKEDKMAMKYLSRMGVQVKKMTDLVRRLLDIARIQTGKIAFRKERFDMVKLVTEVVSDIQQTTKKQLILQPEKKENYVFADRLRISQVITNFLTNAIAYSPKSDKVIIRIERKNKELMVSVQDFGIGISKEAQAKVFNRFYQVDKTKENVGPSLGLGLYISSEIIKRHGGRIGVESKLRKGSTFFFTLPAV